MEYMLQKIGRPIIGPEYKPTLRTVRRVQVGPEQNVGHPMYSRSANARSIMLHNAHVRRYEFANRQKPEQKTLAAVHAPTQTPLF